MGSKKRLSEQQQPLLKNLSNQENNKELFPTIVKKKRHKRAPFINRELRKEDLQ
jgi:hypothetical protein